MENGDAFVEDDAVRAVIVAESRPTSSVVGSIDSRPRHRQRVLNRVKVDELAFESDLYVRHESR